MQVSWHHTGMSAEESPHQKSGRVRSGKARMDKLTPEQRAELAKTAAASRWQARPGGNIHKAPHVGILHIGEAEIPCAVLEDGTRVVSERGLVKSFGGKRGGYY